MTSFSAESAHDDPGATHFDAVEAGFACHPECAVAEIARLRAELAEMTARRDYWRLMHMRDTSELVAATAELAEARKDAERYRAYVEEVRYCTTITEAKRMCRAALDKPNAKT